jgi:hypothetical protein
MFILLVEGKMLSTLQLGIEEIEELRTALSRSTSILNTEMLQLCAVSAFSGVTVRLLYLMRKSSFYLADNGRIVINNNAPLSALGDVLQELA